MTIRMLLVDDHQVFREGLRMMLSREPDIEVVGEAENGLRAAELAREIKPDLVLMDITMEKMGGIEATRRIRAECPAVKILALSVLTDEAFVGGMLEAGANGYAVKGSSFREILEAVRVIMRDQSYLSPAVTRGVVDKIVHPDETPHHPKSVQLSPRELEMLRLLAAGKSAKEIAQDTGISVRTVDTHRHHIMQKLNIDNLPALTKYAIRMGMASVED